MNPRASAIAFGAVSPLGVGEEAVQVAALGEPARVAVRRDPELERAGFARPFAARAPDAALGAEGEGDRADRLLASAMTLLLTQLERVRPIEPSQRVGLVLGTSSGGMCTAEELFRLRSREEEVPEHVARGATYFAPFARARRKLEERGVRVAVSMQIVTACAASTWALGVGLQWLERGAADLVLAGGYDALCTFVASGFESLRATSATMPAPFRVGRDGMALGEGAALVALVREGDERRAPVRFFVSGFGASTDAVHITAPDRSGGGVARAAEAALRDAALAASACSLVSAHATSTPFNDAMEARAIQRVFGASAPVVQPFKAQIGHTLGAAGVLETLALASAIEAQIAPPAAGSGVLDDDAAVRLLQRAEPLACDAGLKLSAAFGGANAALVIERGTAPARPGALTRPRARVYLKAIELAEVADAARVAEASGVPLDKIVRLDGLSLLLASAVARLGHARIAGAGIIVGHALATIDINERFFSRVMARGPSAAEPRLFPPTSPNVMPGQVAILFGLTGPSAATASGPGGACDPLTLAVDLVASGRAEKMVVSAVDLLGPASRCVLQAAFADALADVLDGAVAALVDADPRGALCEIEDTLASSPRSGPCFGQRSLAEELFRRCRSGLASRVDRDNLS